MCRKKSHAFISKAVKKRPSINFSHFDFESVCMYFSIFVCSLRCFLSLPVAGCPMPWLQCNVSGGSRKTCTMYVLPCHTSKRFDCLIASHFLFTSHIELFLGRLFPYRSMVFTSRVRVTHKLHIHRTKWSHSFPETICHTRYNHIIGDALQTTNNVLSPQNCRRNEESFHTVWDWKFEIINCPAANTKSAHISRNAMHTDYIGCNDFGGCIDV